MSYEGRDEEREKDLLTAIALAGFETESGFDWCGKKWCCLTILHTDGSRICDRNRSRYRETTEFYEACEQAVMSLMGGAEVDVSDTKHLVRIWESQE